MGATQADSTMLLHTAIRASWHVKPLLQDPAVAACKLAWVEMASAGVRRP